MEKAGTYALVIAVAKGIVVEAGKLGKVELPAGYYVYAGSALKGLKSRLQRHLRREKRLHWHIDYLLQQAEVKEIWYVLSREKLECALNGLIAALPGAVPFAQGFGSSDCRCPTHLTRFIKAPPFSQFKREAVGRGMAPVQRFKSNDFPLVF
jgi:Uri superfamily endonuclease